MRAVQFRKILETNTTYDQILTIMKSNGYRRVGHGVDATVWTKTGNSVVKIVMPTQGDLSGSAAIMQDFYQFCQQHKDSPFLPKFVRFVNAEIEHFEVDGTRFILIGMEKLQKLDQSSSQTAFYWLLTDLVQNHDWQDAFEQLNNDNFWRNFLSTIDGNIPGNGNPEEQAYLFWLELEKNPKQLSIIQAFYDIMRDCYLYGKNKGYYWDLHTENIMRRGSTPVIVDPWTN